VAAKLVLMTQDAMIWIHNEEVKRNPAQSMLRCHAQVWAQKVILQILSCSLDGK
jgi:hypothetical protein